MTNLRGVIVPIVNLRCRFGLEATFDNGTVTVVLNVGGRTVGAVVDAVSDVATLDVAQVSPRPDSVTCLIRATSRHRHDRRRCVGPHADPPRHRGPHVQRLYGAALRHHSLNVMKLLANLKIGTRLGAAFALLLMLLADAAVAPAAARTGTDQGEWTSF